MLVKKMFMLELPRKRGRGRPKRGFMDVVKEDTRVDGESKEDAELDGCRSFALATSKRSRRQTKRIITQQGAIYNLHINSLMFFFPIEINSYPLSLST